MFFTAFSTLANIAITQHFIEALRISKPQSFGSEQWLSLQDPKPPQSGLTRHRSHITRFDHCCKSLLVLEHFVSRSRVLCPVSFWNPRQSIFPKLRFCSFYFAFPNSRWNLAQQNLKGWRRTYLSWLTFSVGPAMLLFQNPIPCTAPSSKKVCPMLQAATLLRAYPSSKSKYWSFCKATSTLSLYFSCGLSSLSLGGCRMQHW